jgi:hypothetical protein
MQLQKHYSLAIDLVSFLFFPGSVLDHLKYSYVIQEKYPVVVLNSYFNVYQSYLYITLAGVSFNHKSLAAASCTVKLKDAHTHDLL